MKRRSELKRGRFVKRGRALGAKRKDDQKPCSSCQTPKYEHERCSFCGQAGERLRVRKKTPEREPVASAPLAKPVRREPKPRRAIRRQKTEWDIWRPHLKAQFEAAGILECEVQLVTCRDCKWNGHEPELRAGKCPQCSSRSVTKHCWHREYTSLDGTRNPLTFAHVDKRRFVSRRELYLGVVRACWPCHDVVEKWGRSRMRPFLEAMIARRGWTPSFAPPPE
jgi:hypothetical protein